MSSVRCGQPTPTGPCQRPVTRAGGPCGASHPDGLSPTGAPPSAAAAPLSAGPDPFAATGPDPHDAALAAAGPDGQYPEGKPCTTSTPWGKADYSYSYGRGVTSYSTPGHGGIIVAAGTAATMPEPLRSIGEPFGKNGALAFEEDCAATAVIAAFPERFPRSSVESALASLPNWYPDEYQAWSGRALTVEDSHVLRERQEAAWRDGLEVVVAVENNGDGAVTARFRTAAPGSGCDVHMPTGEYKARRQATVNGGAAVYLPAVDEPRTVRAAVRDDPAHVADRDEWEAWTAANPDRFVYQHGSYYQIGPARDGRVGVKVADGHGNKGYVVMSRAEMDATRPDGTPGSFTALIPTAGELDRVVWTDRADPKPPAPPSRVAVAVASAARSDNPAVVAGHAADPNPYIAANAAANPACPPGDLALLAACPHPTVRYATAANPNTPVEHLDGLAGDTNPGVRWAALSNPGCPPGTLTAVLSNPDIDEADRAAALANPACPPAAKSAAGLLAD